MDIEQFQMLLEMLDGMGQDVVMVVIVWLVLPFLSNMSFFVFFVLLLFVVRGITWHLIREYSFCCAVGDLLGMRNNRPSWRDEDSKVALVKIASLLKESKG